jgi:prophage regulatory protein
MKLKSPYQVLIPLPGIGTLSLSRAEYEAALIPIKTPEAPRMELVPARSAEPPPIARDPSERSLGLRYLRLPEVCARVGLKPAMIYRLIGLGRFPKQVKVSERSSRWVESEVERFMAERVAARDRPTGSPAPGSSPYLRMGEVMKLTGLTSSMLYDQIREGTFPKWAMLPKIASSWLKSDVETWLAARAEAAIPPAVD